MKCPSISRIAMVALLSLTFEISGCAVLIGGAVAGGAAGAAASVKESREESHKPMTYVGTVLVNVGYVPAKVVFAGVGAATSGVAYLVTLGNSEKARPIWNASVGGNYVVTPSMIDGEQTIHFVG
jgi:hypothetical protein